MWFNKNIKRFNYVLLFFLLIFKTSININWKEIYVFCLTVFFKRDIGDILRPAMIAIKELKLPMLKHSRAVSIQYSMTRTRCFFFACWKSRGKFDYETFKTFIILLRTSKNIFLSFTENFWLSDKNYVQKIAKN